MAKQLALTFVSVAMVTSTAAATMLTMHILRSTITGWDGLPPFPPTSWSGIVVQRTDCSTSSGPTVLQCRTGDSLPATMVRCGDHNAVAGSHVARPSAEMATDTPLINTYFARMCRQAERGAAPGVVAGREARPGRGGEAPRYIDLTLSPSSSPDVSARWTRRAVVDLARVMAESAPEELLPLTTDEEVRLERFAECSGALLFLLYHGSFFELSLATMEVRFIGYYYKRDLPSMCAFDIDAASLNL
ncbi:hypothetical protein E2562_002014 [Oryza meyeriana var. granulata]|uniref:Uncharacterized protein n=1 Tax=Oryza meyeriana var. granulata TaxID=110450 RepID=A0A6G1C3K2_9ORYZ|nr:hypothetical protein E2562_002014 [Oryza meyeriana var. granulata]